MSELLQEQDQDRIELVDSPQEPANSQIRDRTRNALLPLKDSYLNADVSGMAA